MSNHESPELLKAHDAMEAHLRLLNAIEAVTVYFLQKYGKDVGNARKEFVITKAMMDEFDPNALLGCGVYFEYNPATNTNDLRCVAAPKEQLIAEHELDHAPPKGHA